jgi:hypothetical protein
VAVVEDEEPLALEEELLELDEDDDEVVDWAMATANRARRTKRKAMLNFMIDYVRVLLEGGSRMRNVCCDGAVCFDRDEG